MNRTSLARIRSWIAHESHLWLFCVTFHRNLSFRNLGKIDLPRVPLLWQGRELDLIPVNAVCGPSFIFTDHEPCCIFVKGLWSWTTNSFVGKMKSTNSNEPGTNTYGFTAAVREDCHEDFRDISTLIELIPTLATNKRSNCQFSGPMWLLPNKFDVCGPRIP